MEGYSEQTGNTAPRVLIVDDNPEIREIIRILLSGEGYELEEAKTGMKRLKRQAGSCRRMRLKPRAIRSDCAVSERWLRCMVENCIHL